MDSRAQPSGHRKRAARAGCSITPMARTIRQPAAKTRNFCGNVICERQATHEVQARTRFESSFWAWPKPGTGGVPQPPHCGRDARGPRANAPCGATVVATHHRPSALTKPSIAATLARRMKFTPAKSPLTGETLDSLTESWRARGEPAFRANKFSTGSTRNASAPGTR